MLEFEPIMVERAPQVDVQTDRHPLEEEGVLETLVNEGRTPSLLRASVGPEYEIAHVSTDGRVRTRPLPGTRKDVFFCFIPPEGTQPGDKFRSGLGVASMVDVVTPTEESRGPATSYVLTKPQGLRIQSRLTAVARAGQPEMK